MCCRNRAARQEARRCCGSRNRGWNNGVSQPRQGVIGQIVNHIVEHRKLKKAVAQGQYLEPGILEEGKREMGVDENLARDLARNEWIDEKKRFGIEEMGRDAGVGMGVDRVREETAVLPSYREALKH